jgi:hypothetical protein
VSHGEPDGGHGAPVLAQDARGGDLDLSAIVDRHGIALVPGSDADRLQPHPGVHLGHHRHEHHAGDERMHEADEDADPPAVVVEGGEQRPPASGARRSNATMRSEPEPRPRVFQ